MKNLLWYVFAGTRGGITRARIVDMLTNRPHNAHQLAKRLELDYKTVRHHLDMLEKNKLLYVINKKGYGATYFISEEFNANLPVFEEIWEKIGRDLGKN